TPAALCAAHARRPAGRSDDDAGPRAGVRPEPHHPPQLADRGHGDADGRAPPARLRLRPGHDRPPGGAAMCTLTVLPLEGDRTRLAFNRDELRTRPEALPPQWTHHGSRSAVHPIDPVSNGTWIAANDAGLALALLNVTTSAPPDTGWGDKVSR